LLINHRGHVKVSDFGIAREMNSSASASSSSSGMGCSSHMADTFVGTYTYMSPERIGGLPYGYAADVWSLGLSLLTLVLGAFPYEGAARTKGYWGLLHDITAQPSPELPPNDANDGDEGPSSGSSSSSSSNSSSSSSSSSSSNEGATYYSPALRDFLAQCLAKDPLKRPSARALLQHPLVRGCTLDDAPSSGFEGGGGGSGSGGSSGGGGGEGESETARLEMDQVCHGLRSHYRAKWVAQAAAGRLPDVPNFHRAKVASLAAQVGVLESTARLRFAALARTLRQDAAALFGDEPSHEHDVLED
jgi:serine/threonine protein kinase